MPKPKIKPQDNAANIGNSNAGTSGTNRQYDQNQGNRGKQLDPVQGSPVKPRSSHAEKLKGSR